MHWHCVPSQESGNRVDSRGLRTAVVWGPTHDCLSLWHITMFLCSSGQPLWPGGGQHHRLGSPGHVAAGHRPRGQLRHLLHRGARWGCVPGPPHRGASALRELSPLSLLRPPVAKGDRHAWGGWEAGREWRATDMRGPPFPPQNEGWGGGRVGPVWRGLAGEWQGGPACAPLPVVKELAWCGFVEEVQSSIQRKTEGNIPSLFLSCKGLYLPTWATFSSLQEAALVS